MKILIPLYVLLPLGQIGVYLANQWAYGPGDAINFAFSIGALHWMLAQTIMAAKVPWFQRTIPYDRRIALHIMASIGIVVAVTGHAVFKALIGSFFNVVTWILLGSLVAFFVVAVLWIPLPGFRRARTWVISTLRRGAEPSYDRSKTIHRLLVHGLSVLLFIHVADAGLFYTVPWWSTALYWTLFGLALVLPLSTSMGLFRRRGRVVSVTAHDSIVEVAVSLHGAYRYRAGQFAFLRARNASGRWEEHPFSFLSSPETGETGDGTVVRFGIRALGDFTSSLMNLESGTAVQLSRPFGDFRPNTTNDGPLCLIGSGIGTVPIISLLGELSERPNTSPVIAFLAVDNRDQVLDSPLVERARAAGIDLRLFIYNEDGVRFSQEFFREQLPEADRYSYYLCSSPAVRDIVTSALGGIGVGRSRIHFESFSFG